MDEVFYWLVNQMVGLQYNYRTQINKHLRKAFKLVDKKGKGEITVTEFFLLMQFIGYYFRIYKKFQETPDNQW
jgi:Ca2+-binding EF-hand superfamily protein